jgi:RNA polymerase sigma factor (TIGR02999 family)
MIGRPDGITDLLVAHQQGAPDAFDDLVRLVYDDLRRLARAQRRRLPGEMLDTTELVHEAYVRLVDRTPTRWRNRGHFWAVSALAMRQILVDHARRRQRQKRGGGVPHAVLDVQDAAAHESARLLDLDLALQRLAAVSPRLVRVVECRYFAGLSEEETAEALGVSLRTAQRDWLKARAWLRAMLGDDRHAGQ